MHCIALFSVPRAGAALSEEEREGLVQQVRQAIDGLKLENSSDRCGAGGFVSHVVR